MSMSAVEFKHQSVRDLAWAIASSPLVAQTQQSCLWPDGLWYQRMYEASLPWLKTLDKDPAELEALLRQQKDRRLGKYFETLWFYWFSRHPDYEIVEHNLQIIIDGETLGEIDFIVFDKISRQTVHWEVAVKFYLGVGDTREMCNWHGPNLRDRLDIKVQHLLQHQSIVSENPRIDRWLKEKGFMIDACAVILKGRLYYPWTGVAQYLQHDVSPPQCASGHLRSVWFSESQFVVEFGDKQGFVPLIKQGWMASIPTSKKCELYTKEQIFKTVSDKKLRFPLQVQVNEANQSWDRVFIVEENWPFKNS